MSAPPRTVRLALALIVTTQLAACRSTGRLAEYDFAGSALYTVYDVPPRPHVLTGSYFPDNPRDPVDALIRAGARVAKELVAADVRERLDSAAVLADVAGRIADRTTERAARFMRATVVEDETNADFGLEVRIREYGIDADEWVAAAHFYVEAQVVLFDARDGSEIWESKVDEREAITPVVFGAGPAAAARDVVTAAYLAGLSEEEMAGALEALADFAADRITERLRNALDDVRDSQREQNAGLPAVAGWSAGRAPYVPGPGDAWERRSPADMGMDPGRLQEAVDYALAHETTQIPDDPGVYLRERFEGLPHQEIVGPTKERGGVNGIVLRGGYIVAEFGDTDREDMTFSVTKSYLSTVAGLAFDDGLIRDLGDPIGSYVTDGTFAGARNGRITWHHLLQQTSEWEGTLFGKPDLADRRRGLDRELYEPGTFWEYNDVRVNLMAYSLLHLFRRPLPEVLAERVMDPIGASGDWRWHGYETSWVEVDGRRMQSVSGGGHWGGGFFIDTRDHARFGLLALRNGMWGERRLVSSDWFRRATTPTDVQPVYGYMWWLNTGRQQFPSAPESAFFANGAGSTNVIYVDRVHDLVTVTRWVDGSEHVDEFIRRVLASIVR